MCVDGCIDMHGSKWWYMDEEKRVTGKGKTDEVER